MSKQSVFRKQLYERVLRSSPTSQFSRGVILRVRSRYRTDTGSVKMQSV
jgi:hypothetical protein